MKPDKEFFRSGEPSFENVSIERHVGGLLKLVLVMGCEFGAFILHYAGFSQTLSVLPGAFLIDVPGLGWVFQAVPDMEVNHLVAGAIALASVGAPACGFYFIIRNRILDDPAAFLSYMPNRVLLIALLVFWATMISVELYNFLTLIEMHMQDPFANSSPLNTIGKHRGLAFLGAVVVSMANAALALFTAKIWVGILDK